KASGPAENWNPLVDADAVITYLGTCFSAQSCEDGFSAGTLDGPEDICTGAPFVITVEDAIIYPSGLTLYWEQSPVDEENWTIIEDAETNILDIEDGIEEPTQFRFTAECESGTSETTDPIEINLIPGEECYCIPEIMVGCILGDRIS